MPHSRCDAQVRAGDQQPERATTRVAPTIHGEFLDKLRGRSIPVQLYHCCRRQSVCYQATM
ncbi:MAG: hypothetical protein M3Z24_16615 [Chloroflexota bacterium]|nr:hypothetical protein [Chloroflexota bacterium]